MRKCIQKYLNPNDENAERKNLSTNACKSVALPLPFALATAADDSAATMPEQLLRIEWHNSTNPLNYNTK